VLSTTRPLEQSLLLSWPLRNHAKLAKDPVMTNITIRKENGNPAPATLTREDPYRLMRDLLRWDPFREMAPVFANDPVATFMPAFEIKETKDSYIFKADVPGVKENELEVTSTGNRLTISGSRTEEVEDRGDLFYACERKYGSFSRAYTLPEGADATHAHAELKGGVLTVAVPKLPEIQPKKIAVQSAGVKA
jgi:HSP20 family protein